MIGIGVFAYHGPTVLNLAHHGSVLYDVELIGKSQKRRFVYEVEVRQTEWRPGDLTSVPNVFTIKSQ